MKVLISAGPGDIYLVEGHSEIVVVPPELRQVPGVPVTPAVIKTVIDNFTHLVDDPRGNKRRRQAFRASLRLAKRLADYIPRCEHDTGRGCRFGCGPSEDFIEGMNLKRSIRETFCLQQGLEPKQRSKRRTK